MVQRHLPNVSDCWQMSEKVIQLINLCYSNPKSFGFVGRCQECQPSDRLGNHRGIAPTRIMQMIEDRYSTLPLSNLTQIFPDWWADRIGVLELALQLINGRAAHEGLYSRGRTIVAFSTGPATVRCQIRCG